MIHTRQNVSLENYFILIEYLGRVGEYFNKVIVYHFIVNDQNLMSFGNPEN